MKNIFLKATFMIHDGKLNEFKSLAVQAMAAVKTNEPGNLQYDWYFNEDNSECVVFEKYADSSAVFDHLANLNEILGKVLQISVLSVEVYGDPSEELRKVITDMKAKLYSFYQGSSTDHHHKVDSHIL